MHRVFLSSTSRDLQAYRDAVHEAIDRLGGFHLVKMEDFTSTGKTPKQVCDEEVRSCGLFIGLLGHFYGSCPPDEAVSFTELEYLAASDADIAPLMFIAPDDLPIAANLREPDESFEHQRSFRTKVLQAHVANEFRTPDDLAAKVTAALAKWERDRRPLSNGLQAVPSTSQPRDKEATTPAKPLGPNHPAREEETIGASLDRAMVPAIKKMNADLLEITSNFAKAGRINSGSELYHIAEALENGYGEMCQAAATRLSEIKGENAPHYSSVLDKTMGVALQTILNVFDQQIRRFSEPMAKNARFPMRLKLAAIKEGIIEDLALGIIRPPAREN